jgi:Phage terminase large subunit
MLSEKLNNSLTNTLLRTATKISIERARAAEVADPVLLARRCGIEPDPWQCDLLRSKAKQIILLCSRQSGKSTTTALIALHEAMYNPGALILLLAPALRQSQELFRKLRSFYNGLQITANLPEDNSLRIELPNGSRVISLPGATDAKVRGFSSVSLLIVDEASRVTDPLYYGLRPVLAVSGGRIIMLSTPFGRRGFFFEEYMSGGPSWERVKITARDCPRIPKDWLEDERRAIGQWWFDQEYGCEFKDTTDQCFSYDDIQAALSSEITTPEWMR